MKLTLTESSWFSARTISESKAIQEIVDAAQQEYQRFDEAYMGLQWLLARDGHKIGTPKIYNGKEYRLHKQAGVFGSNPLPAITVLYSVEANEIDIIAIRIEEPQKIDNELC